jgi:hypothetical protein
MKTRKSLSNLLIAAIFLVVLAACQAAPTAEAPDLVTLEEHPVTQIELAGPVASSQSEVSGMAWCGDNLILLPQFPDQFKEDGLGRVFSIPKSALSAYLDGDSAAPIEPEKIVFDTAGLPQTLSGFEGFEAIAFDQDVVYVTVETRQAGGMMGYLLKGTVAEDCSAVTLDPESRQELPPQADLSNMTDETIILDGDRIYTVYEANGVNVNPEPTAYVFDLALNPQGTVSFPSIEYRVTDATTVDAAGGFWVINYFYPGDTKLKPGDDQLALNYGIGLSHQTAEQVERLVKMRVLDEGIEILDESPIYLVLDSEEAFNWEGLVRMGDGFLLVTDEYPTTILGYVDGVNE